MSTGKDRSTGTPTCSRTSSILANMPCLWGTAILTATAIAASTITPLANALQFGRMMILNGQWWRILTCHFTHWSTDHLVWDVGVFAVLGLMCERKSRTAWRICIITAVVVIPAMLFFLRPDMQTYRGLSGLDSAFFAMLAVWNLSEARRNREWARVAMLGSLSLGFALKLGYEVITGSTFFVDSSEAGFTPIVEAHLIGAIIGTATALLPTLRFMTNWTYELHHS